MRKYIDAERLKNELKKRIELLEDGDAHPEVMKRVEGTIKGYRAALSIIDSLQQESDRLRYCIEYINPQYPLLDNGELNVRHLRVPDEHGAEMALTLMLSFGAKIYALYRGNVKEGKLAEWPTPMIVDTDDWYSIDWLHNILDCGHTL